MAASFGCESGVPIDEKPQERSLSERHLKALRAVGIKGARSTGYNYFICGNDDSILFSTGFVAEGVTGNVCCGMFKGCTVRTE